MNPPIATHPPRIPPPPPKKNTSQISTTTTNDDKDGPCVKDDLVRIKPEREREGQDNPRSGFPGCGAGARSVGQGPGPGWVFFLPSSSSSSSELFFPSLVSFGRTKKGSRDQEVMNKRAWPLPRLVGGGSNSRRRNKRLS
jgi:hypothetical protein